MTGINRTSNALWRNPITEKGAAVADSKPVKLSPERFRALLRWKIESTDAALGPGPGLLEIEHPVEIEGVTYLPAVYREA